MQVLRCATPRQLGHPYFVTIVPSNFYGFDQLMFDSEVELTDRESCLNQGK